jgi:hypothetical protein
MKARQLFRFKDRQGSVIVEMGIWALPAATEESAYSGRTLPLIP